MISIDAIAGTIEVKLSDAEIAERKKGWKARENQYGSGALWKYAQQVGPALYGAVTHPGAKKEKVSYADL
jgi:dihydroxy-acid dehydratase